MDTSWSGIFSITDFVFLQLVVANGFERVSQSAPCNATDSWCVSNEIISGPMTPPLPSTIVYSELCRSLRSVGVIFGGRRQRHLYDLSLRGLAYKQNRESARPGYDTGHGYFPAMWKMWRVRYPRLGRVQRSHEFSIKISSGPFASRVFRISWIFDAEWRELNFRIYYKNFTPTLTRKEVHSSVFSNGT